MTGVPVRAPLAVGRARTERLVAAVFWVALGAASALPQIVVAELTGTAPTFLPVTQVVVLVLLLVVVRRSDRLRDLDLPVRWLVAMAAGWHLVIGGLTSTQAWDDWQHTVPWIVRGAVVQAVLLAPTLLLVVLGSEFGDPAVLLWSLPALALLAATNTVNEEFG